MRVCVLAYTSDMYESVISVMPLKLVDGLVIRQMQLSCIAVFFDRLDETERVTRCVANKRKSREQFSHGGI